MPQADGAKLGLKSTARFVVVDGDLPEGANAESPEFRDRVARIVEQTEHPDGRVETQIVYERG